MYNNAILKRKVISPMAYSSKDLKKFYTKSTRTYSIGSALLIAGFFAIWMGTIYSFILFFLGAGIILAGLVMFFAGSVGKIDAADIDKAISDMLWEFDKDILEEPHYAKKMLPHTENSIYLAHYDYDLPNVLSKRYATSSSSKWYTSSYTAVRMLLLTDGIALVRKTVDPILKTEDVQNGHYIYTDLEGAEIVRQQIKLSDLKREYTVTSARLVIRDNEGTTIFSTSVNDDMESDKLAEQLNKLIAKSKE